MASRPLLAPRIRMTSSVLSMCFSQMSLLASRPSLTCMTGISSPFADYARCRSGCKKEATTNEKEEKRCPREGRGHGGREGPRCLVLAVQRLVLVLEAFPVNIRARMQHCVCSAVCARRLCGYLCVSVNFVFAFRRSLTASGVPPNAKECEIHTAL